jgi:hypothetical protein
VASRSAGRARRPQCSAALAALVAQGVGSDHGVFDLAMADALFSDANKAVSG